MLNNINKTDLFYDYYTQWITVYKEGAIRKVTMDKYLLTQSWIKQLAPDLKVCELSRITYQKLLNDYAKLHERQTTMDFHHQLKGAILDAVDEGLIERDPTRKAIIKGKKPRHKKIKYLNQFELHKLLSDLNLGQEINWDWFILLVAKTGMRFSEALAITPKDFDFSKQSLSINKTWDYKGGGGFMPTKNQSSVRKIQIDWQLIIQFSTLVKDLPEDEPIFVSGKVYNSTVNDILTRHCQKANIPVISVHGLRHTHASLLLFAGVSIASVAQRLGHSSMTTTQKTYLHIIQELENIATKEKAERSVNANENTAEEYAADKVQSGVDEISHDAVYAFDKAGRKGVRETKRNIQSAKDGFQRFKQQRAEQSLRKQTAQNTNSAIKTVDTAEKTIKQSTTSSGKKTIKFAGKEAAKTTQKSVKTAEQTAKAAIKTSQQTAKAAQKTAQATVKTSQKAAQAAKATAKATATAVKAAAKATVAAVKAIIAAVKSLVAAIAAGGWVAVVVIIILCLVGLIAGSVYGIFFSGEDSGTGMSMQTVVQEVNQEYDDRLEQEKNSVSYDVLEMSGSRAVWKDVLAVYSVKVNTNADNPMEVATVDETKKQLLSDIFWEMNSISSRTETKSHTEIEESDDGHGNIVETETTVTEIFLYITVSHKTVDEMATAYGFNQEQKDYLAELLKDENNQLWSQVLYGIGYSDDQIVSVALSQVGNVGGQPYWSWYGFDSRVEWCACFVSWCANECGYIDAGIIPKYAGCVNGAQWFKDRGQWADRNYEPAPGTIIFFDWEGDGETDHTGIVQKCENGIVYTVEGNSGDACRQRQYTVGSSSIYGYGIPAY